MKMFKRITATLVLVFSLCSIAWGNDAEDLMKRYGYASEFVAEKIKSKSPTYYQYDEKTANDFEKSLMKAYPVGTTKYAPYFQFEENSFELKEDLYKLPENGEIIVGSYQKCELNINYTAKNLLWCFAEKELEKDWNKIFIKKRDKRICIIEYLGLNPNDYVYEGSDIVKDGKIVFYKVKVDDLMRPAYEPDPRKAVTKRQVEMMANENNGNLGIDINKWAYEGKKEEMLRRIVPLIIFGEYVRRAEPLSLCTRMGYTLNYRNAKLGVLDNYFGLAEFIVLDKSKIEWIGEIMVDDNITVEDVRKIVNKR